MICATVLIRGRRPNVTMMSQNSHWNGQPRENWRLPNSVVTHLQQVEPRRRHLGHVGLLGLLVAVLVPALLPLVEEPGPGLLGLADEDDVGQLAEVVLLRR